MALVEAGYLFLGKAELIPAHTHVFRPVNLKHHSTNMEENGP